MQMNKRDRKVEFAKLNPPYCQRLPPIPIKVERWSHTTYRRIMTKIFGTRFWGFEPVKYPFVGFSHLGSRNSLIAKSVDGDLVLVLGTKGSETAADDRGMLLGLIEFERTEAYAADLAPIGVEDDWLRDEEGAVRWPYAVPALRAWRFDPPRDVWEVLQRQLTMAATSAFDQLSPSEVELVLALPKVEIPLPRSRAHVRRERVNSNKAVLDPLSRGQPGPPPSEWSAITSRTDGPTATYLFRFGNSDIWKIGISQNPRQRLNALNFSVPFELLRQNWDIVLEQRWPSGAAAYEMEQAILDQIGRRQTQNERFRCAEKEITRLWNAYVSGAS